MHVTPLRRRAAGATATALLAGALLIPAAIAAADDLPAANETVESAVDPTVDPTTVDPASASEPPASEAAVSEGASGAETTDTPEPAPSDDIADAAETEPVPLTPTAASTDDPQDPEVGAIGPGETATFSYPVAGARFVYVYAIGDDLAVTVVRADGSRLPVPSNGSVHSKDYYWIGQTDGIWKLEITNTGTSSVTPEHGLTYSTDANWLDLTSSVYAPALRLTVNPTIGGVPRSDLTVWSEVIGPDGSRHTQQLSSNATSYIGLPSGDYFARVWTVVDGVTYQESRVVGVHVAESDPPSVVISTTPATPNAAGWFRTVSLNFTGNDSGSGFSATFYTIDGGPEIRASNGISYPLTGDGEHTVRFRGEDHQGNFSDWQESTIRVDATAPVIALYGIVDGGRYAVGEELFVEYQCGDATSGLVGDDCTADLPDGARVDTTTPGDYTFTIRATDLAGNTTRIVRSYSVVAPDTTDPVVEVDVPAEPASGWYLDTVTVRFTASDESGIRRIHYEYDTTQGTVSRDIEAETAEVTFDRSQFYTLSYWAEDNAGNRSEGRDLHLYVDATAPWINLVSPDEDELSILPNGHFAQNERVVIDFSCDDDASGIASCDATTPDGELLPTGTPGTHELRIVATDVAGHRTERVVSYTVDAAAPNGNGGVVTPAPRLASTGAEGLAGSVALAVLLLGAGATLALRRRVRAR
ncbi:MAG: Ig-like domain repeat protein [Protaetiibacter sp.]